MGPAIDDYGIDIVSVSGGGDPLHFYDNSIIHQTWYLKLLRILRDKNIPFEMHTSYINSRFFDLHAKDCYRIVYHLNTLEQLKEIKRRVDEIVRVVYVVTPEMTKEDINYIADFCKESDEIDEISFRQMVDNEFNPTFYLYDYLREGHKKRWWYIEQCDYNLYYCENRIYTKFGDIGRSENDWLV